MKFRWGELLQVYNVGLNAWNSTNPSHKSICPLSGLRGINTRSNGHHQTRHIAVYSGLRGEPRERDDSSSYHERHVSRSLGRVRIRRHHALIDTLTEEYWWKMVKKHCRVIGSRNNYERNNTSLTRLRMPEDCSFKVQGAE